MYSRLSKLTHPLKTLLIKMFIISIVVFLWNNFEISCLTLSVLCALRSVLGSRILDLSKITSGVTLGLWGYVGIFVVKAIHRLLQSRLSSK